jgi:hypothetical protein
MPTVTCGTCQTPTHVALRRGVRAGRAGLPGLRRPRPAPAEQGPGQPERLGGAKNAAPAGTGAGCTTGTLPGPWEPKQCSSSEVAATMEGLIRHSADVDSKYHRQLHRHPRRLRRRVRVPPTCSATGCCAVEEHRLGDAVPARATA